MSNRWNSVALCAIVVCSVLGPATAQTDTALLRIQGDWQSVETGRSLSQKFHFANEAVSYGLSYDISVPEDLPPNKCTSHWWAWTTGYMTLGMPSPIQANWYMQAFSAIEVDGVSLHDIPADWRAVRHAGSDVLAEGTWQTPSGPVVMRLLLRAGDDKLLVQVALPPDNTAERLEVRLMAYPQGFPEPRSRRAATIADEYEAGRRIDLLGLERPWILLYDQLYDRDHRGGGPCGMLWVPDELHSAVTNLGSYGVTSTLQAKPDGRTITVGLWDFTWNRDVAIVRRLLRDAGRTVSADLRRVAAADWHEGVPAAELPEKYRRQLNELAQARRQPTAFDQMTREIVTPHVQWARPLKDGPVRTLVVGPRWNQRETVELAQRLDMEYRTVSFSSDDALIDPQELYLYDSYEVYGFAKKNETDILFELAYQMAADPECLILTGFRPRILPQETRSDIVERVRAGSGLLLFGHARELLKDFADGGDFEPAAWQPQVVPMDKLPGIASIVQQQRPACTAYTCGRGRVLAFHYDTGRRLGLTPGLSHEDPDVLGYYDYYHSLVADGVLWAAGREPLARVQIDDQGKTLLVDARTAVHGATVELMVHDPQREIRERTRLDGLHDFEEGSNTLTLPSLGPATGQRFVSVWLKQDGHVVGWGTAHSDLGDERPHIAAIEIPEPILKPDTPLEGTIKLSALPSHARLDIELRDSIDRLLAHREIRPKATDVPLQLAACHPITILHEIRVRLYDGDRLIDQQLANVTCRHGRVSQPAGTRIDDFFFLVWSGGENHAIRHHINRILSEGGVDWIDNTGLTGGDAFKAGAFCRNAARYNLASVPYITRIASMQETGRERNPCLHDATHVASWSEGLKQRALGSAPFGPPAYTLGDENFLVRKKLDVCITPHSLAAFHKALRQQYGPLSQLNESWQSDYDDWGQVVPPTFDEVKDDPARWPRWVDHRLFMDRALTEAHAAGREAIRSADPRARVGFDGVFSLDSWHGYDFYGLCQACDLLQVYAQRHEQIEYLRSWQRPEAVLGAWYNRIGNRDETSAKRVAWHLLFHDFNSSWYWTSFNTGPALLFPDLRTAPQFLWMQESIEEIKGGVGKLLLNAQRQHDRIAVYYSQPSVHAGTLMDRGHATAQWGFARLVEDLQLQYDMISYDQVRGGNLKDYQVLLMPACPAISPEEADAIRQFVEPGGMVIADTLPGILDNHCRLLQVGQLDDLFGVQRNGLPTRGNQRIRIAQQELPLVVFDSDLQPAGAQAQGSAADAPAMLVHQYGQGHAVLLNTAIESYESLHFSRTAEPVASVMQELLDLGGIRPQVSVNQDGQPLRDCEVVRYADGAIRYLALVRDNHIPGLQPQAVTIGFPQAAHVYDIRARKSLGHAASVQARLAPGDPNVYALLPYEVQGISITPTIVQVQPGTPAEFQVALDLGGRAPTGSHGLRIEVLSPNGKPVGHYAQNVLCENSSANVSVPLALNDPSGTWTVIATDVTTGESATTSFSTTGVHTASGADFGE